MREMKFPDISHSQYNIITADVFYYSELLMDEFICWTLDNPLKINQNIITLKKWEISLECHFIKFD